MGGFGQIMKNMINWQPSGSPAWANQQNAKLLQQQQDQQATYKQNEEVQHGLENGAYYVGPGGAIQQQMQGPDGSPTVFHRQPGEDEFVLSYPGAKGTQPVKLAWAADPNEQDRRRTAAQAAKRAAAVQQAGQTSEATTKGAGIGGAQATIQTLPGLTEAQTAASSQQRQQLLNGPQGMEVPADVAAIEGMQPGTRILQNELAAWQEHAQKIRMGYMKELPPGGTLVNAAPAGAGGAQPAAGASQGTSPPASAPGPAAPGAPSATPGASGGPTAAQPASPAAPGQFPVVASGGPPLPSDDFGKYFLPQRAKKLYGPNGAVAQMTPQQTEDAFKDFAVDKKDPTQLALLHQITQLHIDQLRQQVGNETVDLPPGSPMFKAAQDLAYGKLTMGQFAKLYSYSRNPAQKLSIYQKASELNPAFNAAQFEMGYKFASQPKVQQQLASLDNVTQAIPGLIEASDKAARSGITALNRVILPGGVMIGGQKYSNLKTAQIAFADELSGALGYGSATDMSREMGMKMTDPSLSTDNFRSALQEVVQPFINRKRSTMLNQMGPYGLPGMNPAASAPTSGGLPKVGDTFNGHKVLNVKRVQ